MLRLGCVLQISAIQPAVSGGGEPHTDARPDGAQLAAQIEQIAASMAAMQEQIGQLSVQLASKAPDAEASPAQETSELGEQLTSLLAEMSGLKGRRLRGTQGGAYACAFAGARASVVGTRISLHCSAYRPKLAL